MHLMCLLTSIFPVHARGPNAAVIQQNQVEDKLQLEETPVDKWPRASSLRISGRFLDTMDRCQRDNDRECAQLIN